MNLSTLKSCDKFQDDLAKLVNDAVKGGANTEEISTILMLTAQDLKE